MEEISQTKPHCPQGEKWYLCYNKGKLVDYWKLGNCENKKENYSYTHWPKITTFSLSIEIENSFLVSVYILLRSFLKLSESDVHKMKSIERKTRSAIFGYDWELGNGCVSIISIDFGIFLLIFFVF